MKNLYEILEIDKNASPEIIKVAYKALVKKYHPDLNDVADKASAEARIKEINDAYDVLSNSEKKAIYDESLPQEMIPFEQYDAVLKENTRLKMELNYQNSNFNPEYRKRKIYAPNIPNDDSDLNNTNSLRFGKFSKLFAFISGLNEDIKTALAIFITFLIIFIVLNIPFLKDLILGFLGSGYALFVLLAFIGYFYFFKNKKQ